MRARAAAQAVEIHGPDRRAQRVADLPARDALDGPLAAVDLDGLRRRTRAQMGRCQGFFCATEVAALLRGFGA